MGRGAEDARQRSRRLWAAALIAMAVAGEAEAGPLEDAVATALRSNPEVAAASANRLATDETVKQAFAGYLPSIDARAASGFEESNNPNTRIRLGRIDGDPASLDFWRNESGLFLRQMLFDGFATPNAVDQNRARTESAAARVRRTAESVGLDAVEAYLQVERRAELVQIARDNITAHQRYLDLVRRRAQQGGGSQADVRQAESRLALAQENLATSQGQLDTVRATFKRVVGDEPGTVSRPQVPEQRLPPNLGEGVGIAVKASPLVQSAESDVEAAEAAYRGTDSPLYPRLDLEVGANHNKNIDGIAGLRNNVSALFVMRYNLYRGGADQSRKMEAGYRVSEARARLDVARRQVEEDLRTAWAAMISSRSQVDALRDQVRANEQVINLYKRQFDLNQRTFLDLLDTENSLFASRGNLVTAEVVAMFAVYRVLATSGLLVESLGLQPPDEGRSSKPR